MAAVKQSNRLMRDQAKAWRVRALAVTKTLNRDANIDTQRFVDLLTANVLNKPRGGLTASQSEIDDSEADNNSDSNDSYHR